MAVERKRGLKTPRIINSFRRLTVHASLARTYGIVFASLRSVWKVSIISRPAFQISCVIANQEEKSRDGTAKCSNFGFVLAKRKLTSTNIQFKYTTYLMLVLKLLCRFNPKLFCHIPPRGVQFRRIFLNIAQFGPLLFCSMGFCHHDSSADMAWRREVYRSWLTGTVAILNAEVTLVAVVPRDALELGWKHEGATWTRAKFSKSDFFLCVYNIHRWTRCCRVLL